MLFLDIFTVWEESKYGVISGPNTAKYGTEITPYLELFCGMIAKQN